MNLPIRHAAPHDLDEMDRIEREAFNTPWSRELIRGAIHNMRYDVRVIRAGGEGVAGFYIAHGNHRRSNLDNLAVDRPYRRQGYGRLLLHDWIERSRRYGLTTLTLQVNVANKAAQVLYHDHDFQVRRILVAYYTNGDDAYEMERAVQAERLAPVAGRELGYPPYRLAPAWGRGGS